MAGVKFFDIVGTPAAAHAQQAWWLDLFAVATMPPPMVWLWRMDRRPA